MSKHHSEFNYMFEKDKNTAYNSTIIYFLTQFCLRNLLLMFLYHLDLFHTITAESISVHNAVHLFISHENTSHFQQWHLINSTSKWWCLNEMGEWWYGKLISPSGIALDTINISPNGWLNNYIMLIAYTILYCTNLHLIITINCLW